MQKYEKPLHFDNLKMAFICFVKPFQSCSAGINLNGPYVVEVEGNQRSRPLFNLRLEFSLA